MGNVFRELLQTLLKLRTAPRAGYSGALAPVDLTET